MRKTIKLRPYNDDSTTDMEPDDYATTQTDVFQSLDRLKHTTPTTLDDVQLANNEKSAKVNELLNKITAFNAENDGNKLANFAPMDKPIITQNRTTAVDANGYANRPGKYLDPSELLPVNLEKQRMGPFVASEQPDIAYSNYNLTYDSPKLFQKGVAVGGAASMPGLDSKLMDKINYMIHLLEDQKFEKTANVTEEFILYIFLGVFVIYTVDSFTRAGKYIR